VVLTKSFQGVFREGKNTKISITYRLLNLSQAVLGEYTRHIGNRETCQNKSGRWGGKVGDEERSLVEIQHRKKNTDLKHENMQDL
jgi:hypothetical protein